MNKYFAVENKNFKSIQDTLKDMEYNNLTFYKLNFAVLYENTITREDYAFIKLKFDVIEPTIQQLQTENRLHKLGIIPDEYPDIN